MEKHKLPCWIWIFVIGTFLISPLSAFGSGETILFHLKTSLDLDDAQLCVAYNVIWAALEEGMNVIVLIDADAVNTYKKKWLSEKDDFQDFKLPERLRKRLTEELKVSLAEVPKNYGQYLEMLHKKGAAFYINGDMLVVAKISESFGDMRQIPTKFFKPITVREILKLRQKSNLYISY
jgi:hypothetical protein